MAAAVATVMGDVAVAAGSRKVWGRPVTGSSVAMGVDSVLLGSLISGCDHQRSRQDVVGSRELCGGVDCVGGCAGVQL